MTALQRATAKVGVRHDDLDKGASYRTARCRAVLRSQPRTVSANAQTIIEMSALKCGDYLEAPR